MIIQAEAVNGNYGGNNITTKYSPLYNPTLTDSFAKGYVALFEARAKLLRDRLRFPATLDLFCPNWPALDEVAADAKAGLWPMIVISSGRSRFIGGALDTEPTVNDLQKAGYAGYTDPKTFAKYDDPDRELQLQLKLWYTPKRSGRRLFVVAHKREWHAYLKALSGYERVHPVLWSLPTPSTRDEFTACGFGASRYAALEMAKALAYDIAWLVDDNVVQIDGFPTSPTTIETTMAKLGACAIGFQATTSNDDFNDIAGKAAFPFKQPDLAKTKPGLLQQAVLWNVAELRTNKINFSPHFVASNEDKSFSNYLTLAGYTQRILKGMSIRKMDPSIDADNVNPGARALDRQRILFFSALRAIEGDHQIKFGIDEPIKLSKLVESERVLQNSKVLADKIQCQAIEQVMAECAAGNKFQPKDFFTSTCGDASCVRIAPTRPKTPKP